MLYIIIGAILALIGFALVQGAKKSAGKSLSIAATDQTNSRNLFENYESVSNAYGKGSFNLYAKLYGVAYSDAPLLAEYSKKECVYYHIKVDREYEELETNTASDGKVTKKWVRKFETVLNKKYTAPDFALKDEFGDIKINARDAKMDTIETYSNFEKEDSSGGGTEFSFAGVTIRSGPTIKTIGFTHVERSVPVGRKLFVIGQASDNSGELMISRPSEKNKPFLISLKSEAEITSSLSQSSKLKKVWGYVLVIAGICVLVYGILAKIGLI